MHAGSETTDCAKKKKYKYVSLTSVVCKQEFDHVVVSLSGGQVERSQATSCGGIDISIIFQQRPGN